MKDFNTIGEILDFAIGEEQLAVDFYSELADVAKTDDMKQVFTDFAAEEIKHKQRLLKIKEEGIFTLEPARVVDMRIADYMVNVKPSPNMTYEEALILAMKKEKAAFKLYSALAEKAPTEGLKNIFLGLAVEESRHKLRFEVEYDEFVLKEN
ncbi:MAG: rubrerythrin [Bacteroidetes bacterium]|nr:rubrerythrin [Bacteroidota bacterium]